MKRFSKKEIKNIYYASFRYNLKIIDDEIWVLSNDTGNPFWLARSFWT